MITHIAAHTTTTSSPSGEKAETVWSQWTARAWLPLILIGVIFAVDAVVIASIRFRCSPLYPQPNDLNSDVYVFQMVGQSWAHGLLPYRDVYDVKGPFLYLLFLVFARIRPWSMGPPWAALALLAFASHWLAYAIARICLPRLLAGISALLSCVLIYLTVSGVTTSFTCEELAVPGTLLLIWLVWRWLDGRRIAAAWWILDGAVFGALFWTKYQVIAPWGAVFIAMVVATRLGAVPARSLVRTLLLNTLGLVAVTGLILPWYARVLPAMFSAYFLAKPANFSPGTELPKEAAFVVLSARTDSVVAIIMAAMLLAVVVAFLKRRSADRLVLGLGVFFSVWASIGFVRHANNFFVPLSFSAVIVAALLAGARQRGVRPGTVAITALAAVTVLGGASLVQNRHDYGLLKASKGVTCFALYRPDGTTTRFINPSVAFARTARTAILTPGQLYSARTSFISRITVGLPYQFVDASWSHRVGADKIQTRYLQDRIFAYVWIHVRHLNRHNDVARQVAAARDTLGPNQRTQAVAITLNYLPVMSCNNEVLLRAR